MRRAVLDYRFPCVPGSHETKIAVGGLARMCRSFCGVACLLLLSCTSAGAQTIVEGTVHDNSGQAVTNAAVSLEHQIGGVLLATSTDPEGNFRIVAVEAGAYSARYLTVDPEKTGSSYTFSRQDLERLPDPVVETTSDLVNNLMPGASDSHDNFLAVRGTEFSLHEFINGVSFLDNTQPQFSAGVSPQIFETVDLMTGGFTPEYGNRFGGVLDISTRSGADLAGHGDLNFRGATLENYDLNADYGGQAGRLGYYFFVDGFTSGRYLDPPQPQELFDFGKGSRATAQFDWHAANKDAFKLLLMGSGANFQQPNITEDQLAGRDAQRHLRQYTAILGWLHTFSPQTLLHTSVYERTGSDQVLPTNDADTPLSAASRSSFTLGVKSDLSHSWRGHLFKAGVDFVRLREGESFFFDSRGDPDVFPAFQGWG